MTLVCNPSLTLRFAVGALLLAAGVAAQCARQWQPGEGLPDVNGPVYASTFHDPDGPGPLPRRLVIGGAFTIAGPLQCSNIAALDPLSGTWTTLGGGITGAVRALAAMPNGDLVATGEFLGAGAAAANYIARWNGSSWSPLGSGLGSFGFALTVDGNGDLIVGGFFTTAGGLPAPRLARWNGSSWSGVGGGVDIGTAVFALLVQPNGELWVGGDFATVGGVQANHLARWNGSQWSAFGNGGSVGANAPVYALHARPSGESIVAGAFTSLAGLAVSGVASWQAGAFTALAPLGVARAATTLASGELLVGGSNLLGSTAGTARWNGSSWLAESGGPLGEVATVAGDSNGDAYAGGSFPACGNAPLRNFARRSAAGWNGAAPGGLDGQVLAILPLPDGSSIIGGNFARAGGQVCNGIARRIGNTWQRLGTGIQHAFGPGSVRALARLPNGDVVAGGAFVQAGGQPSSNLARWNGSAWSGIGGGIGGTTSLTRVDALLVRASGNLVVGGTFTVAGSTPVTNVAEWNGATWTPLGSLGGGSLFFQTGVRSLVELPNGQVVAGGFFPAIGGVGTFPEANFALWNGSTWASLPGLPGEVRDLAVMVDGSLIAFAGGAGSTVARLVGSGFVPLNITPAGKLLPLPNGDLVVAGVPMLRWNGVAATPIAGSPSGLISALALAQNGDILVGGSFTGSPTPLVHWFAVSTTPCPAATSNVGAGCSGSGGPNLLVPQAPPWLGSTFAILATGMPAIGLAVGVRGLALGSTPLSSIVPQSPAGCSLLVSQDLIDLYLLNNGTARIEYALPNALALAGLQLHQQVVALELSASGLVQATSTQAVTLTLGAL
jgi:hypothetical protein